MSYIDWINVNYDIIKNEWLIKSNKDKEEFIENIINISKKEKYNYQDINISKIEKEKKTNNEKESIDNYRLYLEYYNIIHNREVCNDIQKCLEYYKIDMAFKNKLNR